MKAIAQLDKFKDLADLAAQSEALFLGDGSPRKDQEFYLYRGANDCDHQLLSSIQVHFKMTEKLADWEKRIAGYERKLLNRFLKEIEPYRELNHQYQWFCAPQPKTNSFWYLSAMQHFGCPTRLCDFTSDFWTAVFFAALGAKEGKDLAFYRLKCLNNDKVGNKLPKDCTGEPWSSQKGHDMNELLGYIIGYGEFGTPTEELQKRIARFDGTNKSQMYGWDTPHVKNARIQKQSGYFVYGVDVGTPLEDSIVGHRGTEFQKYQISANFLPQIRSELETKGLIEWKVFLDLDRAFNHWKSYMRCDP